MNDVEVSRFLSLVLRHDPGAADVELGAGGWVPIPSLLSGMAARGTEVSREQLDRVVATSDKQRFAIDRGADAIRANQGHSVEVDLGLVPSVPPETLFHGTPIRNLPSIDATGLIRGERLAVHLSADEHTARRVGARRGDHVVLAVEALRMHRDGHEFTMSANGVWLVGHVPPEYLRRLPGRSVTVTAPADSRRHLGGPETAE